LWQEFVRVYSLEILSVMLVFSTQLCELVRWCPFPLLSGSTLHPPPLLCLNKYTASTYTVCKSGGWYGVLGLRQIIICRKVSLLVNFFRGSVSQPYASVDFPQPGTIKLNQKLSLHLLKKWNFLERLRIFREKLTFLLKRKCSLSAKSLWKSVTDVLEKVVLVRSFFFFFFKLFLRWAGPRPHIPFPPDLILYVNLVAMGPVHLSPVTWPQAFRSWYFVVLFSALRLTRTSSLSEW
jgi:hypothetical protein